MEEVAQFTYLGTNVALDGDSESAKRERTFASLNCIWKTSNVSLKTKVRTFRSNVLSVLLYALWGRTL